MMGGLTCHLLHKHEAEILVSNVEDDVRPTLVDLLGDVLIHHVFKGHVGCSSEVFVDQVEWIPLVVNILVQSLGLPIGVESLIKEFVDVHVEGLVESFLLHEFAKQKMIRLGYTYPPYP